VYALGGTSYPAGERVDDLRLYPNQFLLGPQPVDRLVGWRALAVDEDIRLTVHPGLGLSQVGDARRSLTLLGYLLDPSDPAASDADILQQLLDGFLSVDALIAATAAYGGRWVMVAKRGDSAWMFGDALGLRQVFFTPRHVAGGIWAGSQPGIIADQLGLVMDSEAAAFIDSYRFRNHPEYRWPAAGTPFRELRHLVPNHCLDLRTGQVHRYWPHRPLAALDMGEAVDKLARLLPGMIAAATRRFDLALGITAGWDSRLVLAAARGVKDDIDYMTVRQASMPDDAPDVAVPGRLLEKLGLAHDVVRAPLTMSAGFSYIFKSSIYLAHDQYGCDAEAILAYSGRRKAVMTGSGAEVSRCSFRSQLPAAHRRRITAADLAHLQRMDESDFAIRHFQEWLNGLGNRHGVPVLDLFEWEQGHGNWLAMTQLEFDTAWREIFTPYNSRLLLETLLATDERFRRKPDYQLFRAAIERLWPEVMIEPINPVTRPLPGSGPVRRLARMLRKYSGTFRFGY
jgi:hypothetical protein